MTTAEEIFPSGGDWLQRQGKQLRKGSITAAIQNVKTLRKQGINFDSSAGKDLLEISRTTLEPLGFYEQLNWNSRQIQKHLFNTREIKKMEESEVNYNPTSSPKHEDLEVWKDIIDRIESQRNIFPQCPRLVKMLKLLKAHNCWFGNN